MTYIIVKTFAQVGYVIWYIISMGIIRTTQKPFLIPYVNFGRKAFNVIWLFFPQLEYIERKKTERKSLCEK